MQPPCTMESLAKHKLEETTQTFLTVTANLNYVFVQPFGRGGVRFTQTDTINVSMLL